MKYDSLMIKVESFKAHDSGIVNEFIHIFLFSLITKQNVFYVNPEQTQYFVQVQISDKKTALKHIVLYCVFVCLCVCMCLYFHFS